MWTLFMAAFVTAINLILKYIDYAQGKRTVLVALVSCGVAMLIIVIIAFVRSAWRLDNERQEDFDGTTQESATKIEDATKEYTRQITSLKTELENEMSRHGGPKVFLAWEVPEEIAKLKEIVSERYLYLENNSGEIAHNIKIDAIALGETVTFMMVHRLGPKQMKLANPMAEDGDHYHGGMIGFLNQQPNARAAFKKGFYDPHASGQISIHFRYHWKLPMTINYTDGNGNPFCTKLFFLLDSGTGVGELELVSCGRSLPVR